MSTNASLCKMVFLINIQFTQFIHMESVKKYFLSFLLKEDKTLSQRRKKKIKMKILYFSNAFKFRFRIGLRNIRMVEFS